MKHLWKGLFVLPAIATLPILATSCNDQEDYINVANYCDSTGNQDCADQIQNLIINNPNRTLFFKDGIYKISHPIKTPGAHDKSVSLKLSDFACIKASDDYNVVRTFDPLPADKEWRDEYNYMIQLGGLDRTADGPNDPTSFGSNFSFEGGYIDGGTKHAPGLEITGGREARVQNVNIKHVVRGLRIAPGVNSHSSDADVLDVNIICDGSDNSLGMDIDGYDNTITNSRIGKTLHGVDIMGGGNMLRNIHPLHGGYDDAHIYNPAVYAESYGFHTDEPNYFDYCYSDNFGVGFKITNGRAVFNDCFAWWYNSHNNSQVGIKFEDTDEKSDRFFRSIFTNLSLGFGRREGDTNKNYVLVTDNLETKSETTEGYIHNIAIAGRSTLQDKDNDPYKIYHSGVDVDY